MRGIAFFNGSATDPEIERLAHELCFQYFVKPVVTLQDGALWVRQADTTTAPSSDRRGDRPHPVRDRSGSRSPTPREARC